MTQVSIHYRKETHHLSVTDEGTLSQKVQISPRRTEKDLKKMLGGTGTEISTTSLNITVKQVFKSLFRLSGEMSSGLMFALLYLTASCCGAASQQVGLLYFSKLMAS